MGFVRKYLSKDGLIKIVKHSLAKEKFNLCSNVKYSWDDCILSGLAVFGLKIPSLLQFDKLKSSDSVIKRNLKNLYGVESLE